MIHACPSFSLRKKTLLVKTMAQFNLSCVYDLFQQRQVLQIFQKKEIFKISSLSYVNSIVKIQGFYLQKRSENCTKSVVIINFEGMCSVYEYMYKNYIGKNIIDHTLMYQYFSTCMCGLNELFNISFGCF